MVPPTVGRVFHKSRLFFIAMPARLLNIDSPSLRLPSQWFYIDTLANFCTPSFFSLILPPYSHTQTHTHHLLYMFNKSVLFMFKQINNRHRVRSYIKHHVSPIDLAVMTMIFVNYIPSSKGNQDFHTFVAGGNFGNYSGYQPIRLLLFHWKWNSGCLCEKWALNFKEKRNQLAKIAK